MLADLPIYALFLALNNIEMKLNQLIEILVTTINTVNIYDRRMQHSCIYSIKS